MWVYHWHYAISNGHLTETTAVGLGWYFVMIALFAIVAIAQTTSRR